MDAPSLPQFAYSPFCKVYPGYALSTLPHTAGEVRLASPLLFPLVVDTLTWPRGKCSAGSPSGYGSAAAARAGVRGDASRWRVWLSLSAQLSPWAPAYGESCIISSIAASCGRDGQAVFVLIAWR
jgi:hypothetical protein